MTDLPQGWQSASSTSTSINFDGIRCLGYGAYLSSLPHAEAAFVEDAESVQFIEIAFQAPSPQALVAPFMALRQQVAGCAASTFTSEGHTVSVAPSQLSLAPVGQSSVAEAFTLTTQGTPYAINVVIARQGPYAAVLVYADTTSALPLDNLSEENQLDQSAVSKLGGSVVATSTPPVSPPISTTPGDAKAKARAAWVAGSHASSATVAKYFQKAAMTLEQAVATAGDQAARYQAAITELTGLESLPVSNLSGAQELEYKTDTAALDEFFSTPGLYD